MLCKHHHCLVLKCSEIETTSLLSITPLPPAPTTPGNHQSTFVCVGLPVLNVSHKWNHKVLCVWLPSLSVMFSRFIYTVAGVRASFLFMAESYSSVWMDHPCFIHTSVDRQLLSFYLKSFKTDRRLARTMIHSYNLLWYPQFSLPTGLWNTCGHNYLKVSCSIVSAPRDSITNLLKPGHPLTGPPDRHPTYQT